MVLFRPLGLSHASNYCVTYSNDKAQVRDTALVAFLFDELCSVSPRCMLHASKI
jgi:hypothetical protein